MFLKTPVCMYYGITGGVYCSCTVPVQGNLQDGTRSAFSSQTSFHFSVVDLIYRHICQFRRAKPRPIIEISEGILYLRQIHIVPGKFSMNLVLLHINYATPAKKSPNFLASDFLVSDLLSNDLLLLPIAA